MVTPEQQWADDIAFLQGQAETAEQNAVFYANPRALHPDPKDAARMAEVWRENYARCRRILAALATEQEPVAWRIEGEEVNEEWSGSFDYITDDAGVAEESAADGHKVTPLCPCLTARNDPSPSTAATPPQDQS